MYYKSFTWFFRPFFWGVDSLPKPTTIWDDFHDKYLCLSEVSMPWPERWVWCTDMYHVDIYIVGVYTVSIYTYACISIYIYTYVFIYIWYVCKAMYLYQISVKNIPQSCILTHKRCISTTYLHINIYTYMVTYVHVTCYTYIPPYTSTIHDFRKPISTTNLPRTPGWGISRDIWSTSYLTDACGLVGIQMCVYIYRERERDSYLCMYTRFLYMYVYFNQCMCI